jgi:hypothetical protein
MFRNFEVVERIPTTIHALKTKMAEHKNYIQKADLHNQESLQDCVDAFDEVNSLCKSVYEGFSALRADYQLGVINQAFFVDRLRPIKDLLLDSGEMITNPNLKAQAIAKELKKWF